MNIRMQKGASQNDLVHQSWEIGFVGASVDDRGAEAIRFIKENTASVNIISYDSENYQFNFDGRLIESEALSDELVRISQKRIVLDTTTLGFVEILLICKALKMNGCANFSLAYVEPKRYRKRKKDQSWEKRDFELSDEVAGYRAIPGFARLLSDVNPQYGVFFLGFESSRFDRAFEDFQMIRANMCSVVFGVPAFRPGWETDSYANNIGIIKERNVTGGIHFCGAENPLSAIAILNEAYSSLGEGETMFIAPIGTKPTGIGTALFAIEHDDVRILYDHPARAGGRSAEIAEWHLFDVSIN